MEHNIVSLLEVARDLCTYFQYKEYNDLYNAIDDVLRKAIRLAALMESDDPPEDVEIIYEVEF